MATRHLARSGVEPQRSGEEEEAADTDSLGVRTYRSGCVWRSRTYEYRRGGQASVARPNATCLLGVDTRESEGWVLVLIVRRM